jgi:hypothetical protein
MLLDTCKNSYVIPVAIQWVTIRWVTIIQRVTIEVTMSVQSRKERGCHESRKKRKRSKKDEKNKKN